MLEKRVLKENLQRHLQSIAVHQPKHQARLFAEIAYHCIIEIFQICFDESRIYIADISDISEKSDIVEKGFQGEKL